eukprot:9072443-Ditylum_brightwellii.AAC.1
MYIHTYSQPTQSIVVKGLQIFGSWATVESGGLLGSTNLWKMGHGGAKGSADISMYDAPPFIT